MNKKFFGIGINDMPRGWRSNNELNQRIYDLWYSMIRRCYSEYALKHRPSYNKVSVCERWHTLSNFVQDVDKIENYQLWKNNKAYSLDKDIKQKNINKKIYSLDTCIFILCKDNASEMMYRNNPNPPKGVIGISLKNDSNIIYYSSSRKAEKDGFSHTGINGSCYYQKYGKTNSSRVKNHKGYKWYYLDDVPDDILIKYFIQKYIKYLND